MMTKAVQSAEPVTEAKPRRIYNYDDLLRELPESNRPCELWDGELIMSPTPSFYHQEVSLRFYRALFDWVSQGDLGAVVAAPIDMVLSPHHVVQPDVLFIARDRLHIIERVIMGPVDLAAEVISVGGRTRDRIEKRDLYEQYGVKEYWIIDPEAQTVEVFFLVDGQYQLAARSRPGESAASRLLPGFAVAVDVVLGSRPAEG